MLINKATNNTEDKKAMTLKLLSHHMCMKNAQTRNALTVARVMAIGNMNAAGTPIDFAEADVTTVKIVKKINAKNTPNKSLVETGWQNFGKSS